jgi:1,4-alpha-glucan branching enzyme
MQTFSCMLKKRRFEKDNVVKVTFELPANTARETIRLVGEFNGWEGTRLQRQKDGCWKTTVALDPDREYEFRYLIDDERWLNDPQADGYRVNPFGEDNSVVTT